MAKKAISALGSTAVLILSLYLWRGLYPSTDWAILALLPVTALLFMGTLWSSAAVYRASMRVAVRENSSLAWLTSGRLRALLSATVFSLIAVPLLAWHAISSTHSEFLFLALLCFTASLCFAVVEHKLLDHLTPPFARVTAMSAGTLIAAVLFIPILAWANWNFTPQPEAIRNASLEEALQLGFGNLPPRRGWVAELLAPFFALEYGKLWFVVQAESPKWFSIWYSIDAALISLVAARASAVLMSLAQAKRGKIDDANIASKPA